VAGIENYELMGELGRGGMGIVYAARDKLIGRMVAIKALALEAPNMLPEMGAHQASALKEAQAAGQLSHPNIVTIHQVLIEANAVFIVMELVEGETLDQAVARDGDPRRVIDFLMQASTALDYAHSRGIIHRDVKPGNFLVRRDGVLKLTDFGIAKLVNATACGPTALVGTAHYMSPEQIGQASLDGRSDQFSLGVVAWKLLTGIAPFEAESPINVLYHIVHSEPSGEKDALGPAAMSALRRALSKRPEERFSTCTEFVSTLRHGLEGPQVAVSNTSERIGIESGAKPAKVAVGAVFCAVILAVAALINRSARSEHVTRPTPVSVEAADSKVSETKIPSEAPAPLRKGENVGEQVVRSKKDIRKFVLPPATSQTSTSHLREGSAALNDQPPIPAPDLTEHQVLALPSVLASEVPRPHHCDVSTTFASRGAYVWEGRLDRGQTLEIGEKRASMGTVYGGLPGFPVSVEVTPAWVTIVKQPDEAGCWQNLSIRNDGGTVDDIHVNWQRK
jgi:serine/threonine protein kinase